ncbi:MAG: DUF3553 domain-containing protein [Rhodobacteraceae bacterium]|nr:DUF3553 domain-containing protein [Paracoccaceae bacterium]
MNELLTPGDLVTHPHRPDWGLGQVQSRTGTRITVNFENAGKVVFDAPAFDLVLVDDPPLSGPSVGRGGTR